MVVKNVEKNIEFRVSFASNKFVYGILINNKPKKKPTAPTKRTPKKDPEDNLGDVVTLLDTDKIERGVDIEYVDCAIQGIMEKQKKTIQQVFQDENIVTFLCSYFELSLQDLVKLMMEHHPDVFTIYFLRGTIKPFVTRIQYEKQFYEENKSSGVKSKRIFDFI